MVSDINQRLTEHQQVLAETDRLLKDFGPAWKRLMQHLCQNPPVQLYANASINQTQENPRQGEGLFTYYNEILQSLRYLEDRIIAMGEQLDQLLELTPSTELSAIASYTLLEQDKSTSTLKLLEPETQLARTYFKLQAQKPNFSIIDCFLDLRKKLLILIDSESHEISLLFAFRPSGKDFEPIKTLRLCECSWLIKQFRPSEFRFGFAKICDLRQISWAVALAYRELGYSCRIECGAEAIDVDELIAEVEPSALWASIQEVVLCA